MKSLEESIKEHGICVPLVVRELSKGKYRLVDGHSRLGCVSDDAKVPCTIINGESGTHMIKKSSIFRRKL